MTQTMYKVYVDSLGCAKNLVDSEVALSLLKKAGFGVTENPTEAKIILVNTCGFILDAKEESINRILELAQFKDNGSVLIVTGCLAEKYRSELQQEIPEIDIILGTQEYDQLINKISTQLNLHGITETYNINPECYMEERTLLTPGYYGFLKIAEGCSNNCSFCAIPQMRGKLKSRTPESLLLEADNLIKQGVKELIVIAQDSTAYGKDNPACGDLSNILAKLAATDFAWVRVLYCYPNRITDDLLKTMAKYKNICHYLDIPLQHVSKSVLKNMGRSYDRKFIEDLFARIRSFMPDVAIRTTFMVGFPGETEEDFKELLDFVKANKLTWAGVFKYSQEEDTSAALMESQIDEATKTKRYNKLMAALALNSKLDKQKWLNQTLDVIIEQPAEDLPGYWLARSQYHAPDVDGLIYVDNSKNLLSSKSVGSRQKIKIYATEVYDVIGELV